MFWYNMIFVRSHVPRRRHQKWEPSYPLPRWWIVRVPSTSLRLIVMKKNNPKPDMHQDLHNAAVHRKHHVLWIDTGASPLLNYISDCIFNPGLDGRTIHLTERTKETRSPRTRSKTGRSRASEFGWEGQEVLQLKTFQAHAFASTSHWGLIECGGRGNTES